MTRQTMEKVAISPEQFVHEGVPLIGFHTARFLWETKQNVSFVNVLTEKYYEGKVIAGSEWLPLDRIEEDFERLHPDKDELIVTYCASFECPQSTAAARKLMKMGYTHVLDYKGGMKEWQEHGMAVEQREKCGCEV